MPSATPSLFLDRGGSDSCAAPRKRALPTGMAGVGIAAEDARALPSVCDVARHAARGRRGARLAWWRPSGGYCELAPADPFAPVASRRDAEYKRDIGGPARAPERRRRRRIAGGTGADSCAGSGLTSGSAFCLKVQSEPGRLHNFSTGADSGCLGGRPGGLLARASLRARSCAASGFRFRGGCLWLAGDWRFGGLGLAAASTSEAGLRARS